MTHIDNGGGPDWIYGETAIFAVCAIFTKQNAKKRQNRHCVQEGFEITELPGICYEVTSEVMGLHERLVVEVGDCGVLDVATNIEHLNSNPITNK